MLSPVPEIKILETGPVLQVLSIGNVLCSVVDVLRLIMPSSVIGETYIQTLSRLQVWPYRGGKSLLDGEPWHHCLLHRALVLCIIYIYIFIQLEYSQVFLTTSRALEARWSTGLSEGQGSLSMGTGVLHISKKNIYSINLAFFFCHAWVCGGRLITRNLYRQRVPFNNEHRLLFIQLNG